MARRVRGRAPGACSSPALFDPNDQGLWEPVTAAGTPRRLLEQVYSDRACVTQLDGTTTAYDVDSAVDGAPTSSSSTPGLMADMLHALDVHDGHQVVEISTGSGYNVALLCHRLGDHQVRSIEVGPGRRGQPGRPGRLPPDPGRRRRRHPRRAAGRPADRHLLVPGHPTTPAEADGTGGIIIATIYTKIFGMAMVRLHVRHDGADRADGEFIIPDALFTEARTPPRDRPYWTAHPDDLAAAEPRSSRWTLADLDRYPTSFLAGWVLGDVVRFRGDDHEPALVVDQQSRSWVAFDHDGHIREGGGPRQMWQETEPLLDAWQDTGHHDLAGFPYETGTGPDGADVLVCRSTGQRWPRRPY